MAVGVFRVNMKQTLLPRANSEQRTRQGKASTEQVERRAQPFPLQKTSTYLEIEPLFRIGDTKES